MARVQPFEQAKDLLRKLRADADSVVANRKEPFSVLASCGRTNHGWNALAVVLYGVTDQVLEKLLQLDVMDPD